MAELVLTDAFVSIGAVDLSDHVRQVTINYGADIEDSTAMGDTAHERLGGLIDWSVDLEFNQDYAASEVDVTLFALVGTSAALVLRPTSAAASATNPEYTGNAILESYNPIQGAVGGIAVAPVTFQGNGALARATS